MTDPARAAWNGLALPCEAAESPDVVVIGVPFEGGAGGAGGASLGPGRIRELSRRLKTTDRRGRDASGLRLLDAGDVQTWRFDLARSIKHIQDTYQAVFRQVSGQVLTLGGDHSITYPIVTAAATDRDIGLVWIDAHPDVLDEYQGSAISHGSPLRRIVEDGAVAPEAVLLVGTRAYDPGEVDFIRRTGIREVPAAIFAENPLEARQTYRQRLADISRQTDAFYISIDIDVLDASCVPGTGTPVAGGLSTAELFTVLEQLPPSILACDVVEFAPNHDVGTMTGHAVTGIITALLGHLAAYRDSASKRRSS